MNHSSSRTGRRPRGSRRRSGRPNSGRPSTPSLTFWQRILLFLRLKRNGGKSARPVTERSRPIPSPSTAPRTAPKPELVEVTSPRLYVGNLSFQATENDLSELFSGVGTVASAEVVTHRATERSKGFAFVQMQSIDEAKRAVRELHDQEFMGRKLVVSGAKVSDTRYAA